MSQRDSGNSRASDSDATPDLNSKLNAELLSLGLEPDIANATPEEKAAANAREEQRIRKAFFEVAKPVSQLAGDAKELRWVVDKLIPVGSIIALAGQPKKAKKSLLAFQMCLDVARGGAFLGMDTLQGEAIFANFEDGYDRCARRVKAFGITAASVDDVKVLVDPSGWTRLLLYVRKFKPRLVVLDPLMELELLLGCRDENRADELGKMLAQLREIVRASGTSFLVPHHLAKATGMMRGSSALEGALDGWIYIHNVIEPPKLVLSWTSRDGADYHMDYVVQFDPGTSPSAGSAEESANTPRGSSARIRFAPLEPPQLGEYTQRKSRGNGEGAAPGRPTLSDADVQMSVRRALLDGPAEGLGRDELRAAAHVSNQRLATAQQALLTGGLIEKSKRGKLTLTDAGRALAAQEKPRAIKDLLGSDDGEPEEPNADDAHGGDDDAD